MPFPEPSIPAALTDAAATVELKVKLRSLVLSISTDSVCVGLRMMERMQQYQQHAHLWQGRPQVSLHTCYVVTWHASVAFSQLVCTCLIVTMFIMYQRQG